MKKTATIFLSLLVAASVPVIAGAQINSAGNGSWTAGRPGWAAWLPTSVDDVFIAAGDTISVDDMSAECRSVSFGGDDAQIDMNASTHADRVRGLHPLQHLPCGVLGGLVGDRRLHQVCRFGDPDAQRLEYYGGSTSFRDVIVDKDGGKLTTEGNGMRLGIQNSLEIVNGLFELAPGDDLEARWASSGNYRNAELPNVTIQAGGEWYFADGDGVHHVRSYYSCSTPDTYYPIGTVTIYGKATFRDGSTNKISFAALDVEAGGKLITSLGMGGQEFNCGPLHIKEGGELENYTTSRHLQPELPR